MNIEELKVLITAETKGLKQELQKVNKELNQLEKDVTKSTNKIRNSFKNLFAGISFAAIGVGLLALGKTAIDVASDLQEVENVVKVSFGAAAAEVEKFAKSAITSYGLSELTAKRMASTFMAMSNGLGIIAETGKQMSLTLTGLAGDMASFYNVSQDVAETALKSIFTGETESLKQFGVVMTQANLQAFALSKGITKSVQAMSQAEQTMLRYQFVLEKTTQAQGDFTRTSGSWANQVRVLTEQWRTLLGILGNGLIQVLTPLLQQLNQILASLISIANAVSKAFGWSTIDSMGASVESAAGSAGDLSGSVEDTTGNLNDANAAAKKLSKTISGFDEINILTKNTNAGVGGAGAGLGDVSGGITADTFIEETEGKDINARLEKFMEDCAAIVNKWAEKIPKLQLQFDKEAALDNLESIGLDITNIVAGIGATIATLGISIANDLNVGQLANDLLRLIDSLTGFASTLTNIVAPVITDFYNNYLSPIVKWIGEKLSEALTFSSKQLDDWGNWFEENEPLVTDFANSVGNIVEALWAITEPIADASWAVLKEFLVVATELLQILLSLLLEHHKAVLALVGAWAAFKFADLIIGFGGLVASVKNGYGALNYLVDLLKAPFQLAIGTAIMKIKEIVKVIAAFGTALKALWALMLANPITLVIAALAALVAGFVVLWNKCEGFRNFWINLWETIKQFVVQTVDNIQLAFLLFESFMLLTVENIKKNSIEKFELFKTKLVEVFQSLPTLIKAPINAVIGLINGLIQATVNGVNRIIGVFNKIDVKIPSWVPGLGGKQFKLNIKTVSAPKIPLLADGGVITKPTIAMMGEYAGARTNPEIVTPQNLLRDVINSGNDDLISAMYQMLKQLITSIDNIDMNVSIGDEVIARSAARGNKSFKARTGKPLFT